MIPTNDILLPCILDSLTEGLVVQAASGQVIASNRAVEQILGLSREQIADVDGYWSEWDALREDGSPFPRESYPSEVTLRTGQPQTEVVIGIRKRDGSRAWLSVNSRPISREGPPAGVVTAVSDITGRKRAEEALGQRNRYIDTILEQAPIGFAVHTINDGVGRFVTARFEEIYGVPRGAIDSHLTFFEKVWRNDRIVRDGIRQRVVEDMSTGDAARMHWENVPVRLDDGTTRYITAMNIPLADQNLMVSTVQDVTDRVRAEEARRESEALYRLLAENVTDLIWVLDVEALRFRYVSPSVQPILGYTPGEVIERGWIDEVFALPSARVVIGRLLDNVPEFRRIGHLEYSDSIELTRCDGATIWLEFSGRYVVNDRSGHVEVYGVSRDVTDRRRADAERQRLRDELAHAQKMESVGRLAGGIAHDFNNILADMTVQLGLANARYPQMHAVLEELRRDVDLGAALIRQLLVFSRRSPVDMRPIDLNEVARGLGRMLGRLLGASIAVRFEPAPDTAGVHADEGMVEQIIMNLAVNARDAMPDGGTLTIAITSADGIACLSVSDTGSGMDQETLARAFEPFFTTKTAEKGTGLGLSLVHGIVAQHGGRVEAESVLGKGSTFRIFLTAVPLPVRRVAPNIQLPVLAGTETILLVDDFARLREKIAESLQLLGYDVIQAGNGEEALRLWEHRQGHIDLLFTDISLPDAMTGFQIADALRVAKPSLKVILSSGYGDQLLDEDRVGRGMVYLHKPCTVELIARTIRNCFDPRS
jgi:PAS domain S-box-containing protein